MALSFPTNPTYGQVYTDGNGTQWVFDGVGWDKKITVGVNPGGGAGDGKALISGTDPIANFLSGKLQAGTNVTLTIQEDVDTGEQYLLLESAGGGGGVDISPATQRWVHFPMTESAGAVTLSSVGLPAPFPTLEFWGDTTHLFDTAGRITVHQNASKRVYGDTVIDQLMRLDNLTGEYQCRFFICKLKRDMVGTPMTTDAERIFQYGSQGNDAYNPDGGWVARINPDPSVGAFFPQKSLAFAIHTVFNPDTPKPGTQIDPQFPDPIVVTRVFTDTEWGNGLTMMFVVENPLPAKFKAWAIIGKEGVTKSLGNQEEWSDVMQQNTVTWPLPGMSITGPGNDQTSNGFVLFNQSVNYMTSPTSPLKDSEVFDIWIGTCRNMTEARNIFLSYWNDPNADLSSLLT